MKNQVEMIKTMCINKIMQCVDYQIIKRNIIPLALCFISWIVAIMVLLLLSQGELSIALISTLILLTVQLISSITDIYSRTVPAKLMGFSLFVGLVIFGFFSNTLINSILGGIIAFTVLFLLMLLSKRQVGGGDLALMTVTGLFTGINAFFNILFFSIILSGIYSLILICTKKGSKDTEISFAPFILIATVILVLCGTK